MPESEQLGDYYGYIYITRNSINGMRYIGQACYHRKQPRNYLGSGIYLNRAIKKYGRDKFTKTIIDNAYSPDELNIKEMFWIDFFGATESTDFYNIASGGDGGNTISGFTDERKSQYKKKLSDMRKGKVNLGASNGVAKSIICLNTMEIFECIADAARKYDLCAESISECCRKPERYKTAGVNPIDGARLQWAYYEENNTYEYIPYRRDYSSLSTSVRCITTNKIFKSINDAAREYHVCKDYIKKCCNGELATTCRNRLTGLKLTWEYV